MKFSILKMMIMKSNYTTILSTSQYKTMANAIRALTIDAIEQSNSGHPGMVMGVADIATILFSEFLKYNPQDPKWHDRDRFVLSAGHGSMLIYSCLYLLGYKDISIDDIKNFRQLHSKTSGHPEYRSFEAIETTTGPLGQGIANAVGMAIAEKKLSEKFGEKIVNHHTFVLCGDGCLMEGISSEAIAIAGHLQLNKLVLIFDDNQISIDGPTSIATSEDYVKRFEANNWNVISIDGHDSDSIRAALFKAKKSDKPTFIAARTKIGYGSPNKEMTEKCHGSPLGKEEAILTKQKLNWNSEKFTIPEDILNLWRDRYLRCLDQYNEWQNNATQDFYDFFESKIDIDFLELKNIFESVNLESSRVSSAKILEYIASKTDVFIGGSADLSGSNGTKNPYMKSISKNNFAGNYLHYGVREHAMVAIMNGIALHGPYIPYSGTFLVFSDYCKHAIRLAAMMCKQVILILTHDSIGLGEDGPTHQPIEQLASLRSIPNLTVLRPADMVETIESWEIAISNKNSPTALILSRQDLPKIRDFNLEQNLASKGAYIVKDYLGNIKNKVTIFSTGSEVSIAIDASKLLESKNIDVRIVSMPSWELFEKQSKEYKDSVIDKDSLKCAVEASLKFGWERYIGREGIFLGMTDYGESGKWQDLYNYYGITAENLSKLIYEAIIYEKV